MKIKLNDILTDTDKNILNIVSKYRNHLFTFNQKLLHFTDGDYPEWADEIIDDMVEVINTNVKLTTVGKYLLPNEYFKQIPFTKNFKCDNERILKPHNKYGFCVFDIYDSWKYDCNDYLNEEITIFDLFDLIGEIDLIEPNDL